MVEDQHFGVANHIIRNYSMSPARAWWMLCPGSNTVGWMRRDESSFSPCSKVLGSVMEPACDLIKGGIYSGMILSAYIITTEFIASPIIQEGIEKLL